MPGPIAATRAPASARASSPARLEMLEEVRHAVGAREADEVEAGQGRQALARRHGAYGRGLDHVSAERPEPRGELGGLRAGARHRDGDGGERRRRPPVESWREGRHLSDDRDRRSRHGGLRGVGGDRGQRADHGPLAGERAARHDRRGLAGEGGRRRSGARSASGSVRTPM